MRAIRIPADEQFRLIMECRASGTMISSVQNEINQPVQNGVMGLSISGAVLQIPNGTNLVLLRQTLYILKETSYE